MKNSSKKLDVGIDNLKMKPIEKMVLIDQIVIKIESLIVENRMKPGDALPSERVLAEILHVSRTSIRQALKALDFIGVLEISPGKKTILSKSINRLFVNPFRFMKTVHDMKLSEFIDARKIIEIEMVRRAAKNANQKKLKIAEKYLEESKTNINDLDKCAFSEVAFHQAIFDMTGNRMLSAIMLSLNNFLLILEGFYRSFLNPEDRKKTYSQHLEIYNAISKRDPDAAAKAMLKHLNSIEERLGEIEDIN